MERDITREYRQAHKEVQAKLDEYLSRFVEEDKRQAARVMSGEITQKEHNDWRVRHIGMSQRWEELRDNLAKGYHRANQNAMEIAKGYIPEVFAANYEYGTMSILKQGTLNPAFSMVDRNFVDTLIRDNPKLLPDPTPGGPTARMLAEHKDLKWNRNKLQSAMIQGCLQGESIRKLADRFQAVTDMNRKSALRNARTAVTGAAGAGRLNSYRRAEKLGVPLVKEWSASIDNVTRDSHVDVNGERREIEEEFSNGLMHPGAAGPPEEVYNCFVGETIVAADSEIERSYRHEYEGDLITIKTAMGVEFSCTPNHPILGVCGWVPANLLDEGDYIAVTRLVKDECFGVDPDINHVHSRIDAVHELLYKLGGERTRTLGVNFHGDIPTSDVEVITHKRLLGDGGNSGKLEEERELWLKNSLAPCSCQGSLRKGFRRVLSSASRLVSSVSKSLPFFRRSLRHSEVHGFGAAALNNSVLVEPLHDGSSGCIELIGKDFYRLPGIVFADKIVDIDVKPFHGDVYNLQTCNGYYFVNSIISRNNGNAQEYMAIAHNCRCDLIAWVKGHEPREDLNWTFDRETQSDTDIRLGHELGHQGMTSATKIVHPYSTTSPRLAGGTDTATRLELVSKTDGVKYNAPAKMDAPLTQDQIIDKIAGKDPTRGSCSSQAFTYVGNKAGYDVKDYRGGRSCEIFTQFANLEDLANAPGVVGYIERDYNDYNALKRLFENVKGASVGKEYVLSTGKHTAIIQKTQSGWDYLELQLEKGNGFHRLNNEAFKERFYCYKTHTTQGIKYEDPSILIDVDSLIKNDKFINVLGYLNTNV